MTPGKVTRGETTEGRATGGFAAWRLAWRLAQRELRSGLTGFRVFLACLFLGVAAIAAVGSVSTALLDGLRQNARTILGADLEVRLVHREADDVERAFLETQGELGHMIRLRAMARGEAPDARRKLIELRGVDDSYPFYGETLLEPAMSLDEALRPQDGVYGIAVEPSLLGRLGVALGDRLRIGETVFELRALLASEPDRASRSFLLGPGALVTLEGLVETELIQPGSLVYHYYRLRLPPGETAAAVKERLQESFPTAGWRLRDPQGAAPGIRRFLHRVTLFLSLVGLTALLVGGVGVGNAVRSYLDSRSGTIATLKCLGAPGRLIFRSYLLQILALALVGVAAGLAVGAVAPYLVDAFVGDSLGWRASLGVHPEPLIKAGAFGLMTALTFSLWPLARARSIAPAALFRDLVLPARGEVAPGSRLAVAVAGVALAALVFYGSNDRAIALWFIFGTLAAFALFRLAGLAVVRLARQVPRPRRPGLRLALANLHRPGAPTPSVVLSLGIGLTVLVAIALVEGNLARQIDRSLPEEAPAFFFIDIQPDQAAPFEDLVRAQPGVRGLERVPMLRGRISAVNGASPQDLQISPNVAWVFRGDRGLTWSREAPSGTELVEGAWWPADYAGPPLVSLDAEVGEALGLLPGDKLTVNILGRNLEVEIANLRRIDWGSLGINFVMVFSPGALEGAPQTQIATVRVDPEAEDGLEQAVADSFANVSAIRVREVLQTVSDLMGRLSLAVRAIAGLTLVAGVLVLAGAIAAGRLRRRYDAVVLKVLGAARRTVAGAFIVEYGLLGVLTATIAAALGSLAAYLILTYVMRVDFVFIAPAVVVTAALGTLVTLLVGFLGTWTALSQKAAPLLRNE